MSKELDPLKHHLNSLNGMLGWVRINRRRVFHLIVDERAPQSSHTIRRTVCGRNMNGNAACSPTSTFYTWAQILHYVKDTVYTACPVCLERNRRLYLARGGTDA